ncbi:MAG TPA: hypothetical protein PLC47_02800, partial [Bacteroidales bacterium]|nr:hypothetical protein [Bacteroidales bacterium]
RFTRLFIFSFVGSLLLLTACKGTRQVAKKPQHFWMAAFYNVENLFDTINDPLIDDEEFLPDSKLNWNTEKYRQKLAQKARVIASMDSADFPHFIGLAEVENKTVLYDLLTIPDIAPAAYKVIHIDDDDSRGIEVAALYREDYFKVLHIQAFEPLAEKSQSMRHVLYVKGLIWGGDTLHLFVNHWTSRYGGKEKTAVKRAVYGDFLRHLSDSLLAVDAGANLIIMGDLNDNPDDESLTNHLKAADPGDRDASYSLFNLSLPLYKAGEGTLFYRGWDFFDQLIVSRALLESQKPLVSTFKVVKHPWMLFKPKNGEPRPNRTASGGRYYGGFSDHLPVILYLDVD